MRKKVLLILSIIIIMSSLLVANVYAKGTLYVTIKDGVPVWSDASSKSTQIKQLSKDTCVSILSTTTNSAGNLWGQTVTGTWLYMGNLKVTSKPLSPTGLYITIKDGVPLRYIPAASAEIITTLGVNKCVTITDTYYTDTGNEWGDTSEGYVVYLGNLQQHTHVACMCGPSSISFEQIDNTSHKKIVYNGDELCLCGKNMGKGTTTTTEENHTIVDDVCTKCGYKRAPLPEKGEYVTTKDNVPLRYQASASATIIKYIEKAGTPVTIVSTFYNDANNPWGNTSDGYVIYMGNLQKNTVVSVSGIQLNQKKADMEIGKTLTLVPIVQPDNASDKSVNWSSSNKSIAKVDSDGKITAVSVGTATITCRSASNVNVKVSCEVNVSDHTYVGGICSSCGYEYPLSVKSLGEVTYYTVKDNVPIWNRPYSENSQQLKTITNAETAVTVVAETTNQHGNLWYKTNEGDWVYSGNVTSDNPELTGYGKIITDITPAYVCISVGDKIPFKAQCSDTSYENSIMWETSDTSVASIDNNGLLTALKAGTIDVTAYIQDIDSKSVTITVLEPDKAKNYNTVLYVCRDNALTEVYDYPNGTVVGVLKFGASVKSDLTAIKEGYIPVDTGRITGWVRSEGLIKTEPINVNLIVPLSEQVKSYYCGPASVLQVLKSLKKDDLVYGINDSEKQSTLASEMGTSSSGGTKVYCVAAELNKYIGNSNYKYLSVKGNLNYNEFIEIVISSLKKGMPVILHSKTEYLTSYYDNKKRGHYIVISGINYVYKDGMSQYYITLVDPYPSSTYRRDSKNRTFGGPHVVPGGEAYDCVGAEGGRYIIYVP